MNFRQLTFALTFALAVACGGCAQSAPPANSSALPAQNARIREVGEAMEGGGWNVYGNGFLGDWFDTQGGEIAVTVRAAGDANNNVFPLVRLWINQKLAQTFTTDSTDYRDYEFKADVPKGITRIEVEFTNDTNGETPDRNLRIMEISVTPATLAATPPVIGAAQIEKIRKGDLIIKGKPGAKVKVTQLRHEFPFGTALNHAFFEAPRAPARPSAEDRAMFGEEAEQKTTWSEADRQKYLEIARTYFNAGVHENALKWYHTEKRRGELNYADADRVAKWAQNNDIEMRGHTLFWSVDKYVQQWVKDLDDTTLRREMEKHAREVVARYAGQIDEWDVNNEMLHGNYYGERFGPQIHAEMFKWAHQANPQARLYVNDFAVLSGPNADRYFQQIKDLQAAGAPVGGVGFQSHFGYDIDLRHVQQVLDQFAELKLPLKITEFDLKTGNPQDNARQMTDFYRTCFAHPAIEGITMWGFWANSHWVPEAAIFGKDWTATPAALAYHDLVYKEWWTREEAVIPANGVLKVRAFYGRQQIESGGEKRVVELKKADGVATVSLP